MNVWLLCVISLARALVVAAVTRGVAQPFCQWCKQAAPRPRRMAQWLVALLLVVPPLLAAYVFSPWALWAIHGPASRELAYLLLLTARAFPLYVISEWLAPPSPLTDAAQYVAMQQRHVSPNNPVRVDRWFRPREGLLMVLVAWHTFHDFELASFLVRPSWTVGLYDAHAAGTPVSQLVGWLVPPVALSGLMLVTGWLAFRRISTADAVGEMPTRGLSHSLRWCALLALTLVSMLSLIMPLASLLLTAGWQIGHVASYRQLFPEIGVAMLAAAIAATLAYTSVVGLWGLPSRWGRVALGCWCLPGLCGSLNVSVGLLYLQQALPGSVRNWGYVPWIVGLTLSLAPKALVLMLLAEGRVSASSLHQLALFASSGTLRMQRAAGWIRWRLVSARHIVAVWVVAYFGYLDLPTAALLAPTRYVPAPVRIYNLMHYGHSEILAAMLLWTCWLPLIPVTLYSLLVWRIAPGGGRDG